MLMWWQEEFYARLQLLLTPSSWGKQWENDVQIVTPSEEECRNKVEHKRWWSIAILPVTRTSCNISDVEAGVDFRAGKARPQRVWKVDVVRCALFSFIVAGRD